MLHVITGGSGSGKSAYAEAEAMRLAETGGGIRKKYYIATMEPFGEETLQKIEKHQKLRTGKGFETIECYVDLAKTAKELPVTREEGTAGTASLRDDCLTEPVALLECMSNLAANELYREDGAGGNAVEAILCGVDRLLACCAHVVIVTNEVFSECPPQSVDMRNYRQVLGEINCALAERADAVTEVVYGIPVEVKR